MYKIAIIDDGVNDGVFDKCKASYSYCITREGTRRYISQNKKISHGTICAAIIQQYTNYNNILYSIKIKKFNKNGNIEYLVKAIDFCIKNDIKVINLSLGSTDENDKYQIFQSISAAFAKGIIIVAALSNDNIITYPASFPIVIAAKHSEKARTGLYYYKKYDNFTIGAFSRLSLKMCDGTKYVSATANSFAAAFVTAKVINQIKNFNEQISFEDVKTRLFKECINV